MLANRSIPRCTVIPELGYPEVGEALAWLSEVFGFTLRLRIGNHRAQLNDGDGAVDLTEQPGDKAYDPSGMDESRPPRGGGRTASVMVRVPDVDRHCEHAHSMGRGF